MAIPVIAANAASAAAQYGPEVLAKARDMLKKATSGKVTNVNGLKSYIGGSAERLSVAGGALVRAGLSPDDIIPKDMIGSNSALQAIRATLDKTASAMQSTYNKGSDTTLNDDVEGDVVRRRRVEAAIRVYGNEETYFLCHPTGGIPRADFVWYRAVIRPR